MVGELCILFVRNLARIGFIVLASEIVRCGETPALFDDEVR